ncbi:MAG: prepilin-type N-terminal cleavage/methylation domain-containing protein [Chloroflexota bacterium]
MKKLVGRHEKGLGLIEVLISVAILGAVAVCFLTANSLSYTIIFKATEKSISHALAQIKMEDIKSPVETTFDYSSPYDYENPVYLDCNPANGYNDDYPGYYFSVDVDLLSVGNPAGDEIQKLTVSIKHYDSLIFTLEDFKVNR